MLIIINRHGVYIDILTADRSAIEAIKRYFTIRHYDVVTKNHSTFCCYKMLKSILQIPRFGFLELYNSPKHAWIFKKLNLQGIKNMLEPPAHFKLSDNILEMPAIKILKEHQYKIVKFIYDNHFSQARADAGFAGVNLQLDTGTGKTYILSAIIQLLSTPTLVIVHNTPQAEDIRKHLVQYLPSFSIGIYHSKQKIDGDIVVMVINSACKSTKSSYKFKTSEFSIDQFYARWRLVIFDESHKYTSKHFSKLFVRCQARYMFGLSATPNENAKGLDPITMWNVGPLFDPTTIGIGAINEKFTGAVQTFNYNGPPSHTMRLIRGDGKIDYSGIVQQLVNDPYRTTLIVQSIVNLIKTHNIYVFSDRLNHLDILKKALLKEDVPTDDIYIATGGMSAEELDKIGKTARVIFTTMGFLGTGKSIPRMNAVILAIGHKRGIKQCIGRIFRPADEKSNSVPRVIIDIVDVCTILKKQYSIRKKIYDEQVKSNRHLVFQTAAYYYQNIKPTEITVQNTVGDFDEDDDFEFNLDD